MIRRIAVTMLTAAVVFSAVAFSQEPAKKAPESAPVNPFFTEYTTPFQSPPFDMIRTEHFMPAFRKGMEEQTREIAAIVANPAPPTFQNSGNTFLP